MIPKIEIDNAIREVEALGPFPYRSQETVTLTRGTVRTLLAAAKKAMLTEVREDGCQLTTSIVRGIPEA